MAASEPSKNSSEQSAERPIDQTDLTVDLRIDTSKSYAGRPVTGEPTDQIAPSGTDVTHVGSVFAGSTDNPPSEAIVRSLAEKLIDLGILTWADWVSATNHCSSQSGLPELLFYLEKQPARWAASTDRDRTAVTSFQTSRIFEGKAEELRVENYVLLDSLGSGGMGEVFLARNLNVPRLEALKMTQLFEGNESTETQRRTFARFEREKKLLAELVHPGIPMIFHAGIVRGHAFLAMELIRGKTLRQLLDDNIGVQGAFSQDDVLRWIIDVAKVLGFAHSRGVIHRDVKPANIMITDSGEVKVLDLGIARLLLSEEDSLSGGPGITSSGLTLGTPEYMSPEQWADPTDVTPATDIYSLGCVLVYLLSGKPPFASDSRKGLMLAHVNELVPDICKIRPDVPRPLNKIIQRMLEKEPNDRYQNCEELIKDLSDVLSGNSPTVRDVGMAAKLYSESKLANPTQRHSANRSNGKLIVGLSAVILAAVAFGVFQWQRNNDLSKQQTVARQPNDNRSKELEASINDADKRAQAASKIGTDRDASKAAQPDPPRENSKLGGEPAKSDASNMQTMLASLAPWFQQHAAENAGIWKSADEIRDYTKSWLTANPNSSEDRIKTEVVHATRKHYQTQTAEWLRRFQSTNRDIWPDSNEFDNRFAKTVIADSTFDARKLQELQSNVERETQLLRNPFASLKLENSKDKDLDQRLRFFISLFQQLSSAAIADNAESGFDVAAMIDDMPVTQAPAKREVRFVASTRQPGYVTTLVIPNTGRTFAHNSNSKLEPGKKRILFSTTSDDARTSKFVFFLTDFNPLDNAPKPVDGQFPFEDGPNSDFLGRAVVHLLDEVEHRSLRSAFSSPEIYDRILNGLQSNQPHPLSIHRPVGKRIGYKLLEVRWVETK